MVNDSKLCPCGWWIVDISYQIGRATELARNEPDVSNRLASLANHLLREEVEKCFKTKDVRKELEKGMKAIDDGENRLAYDLFMNAKAILEKKVADTCKTR